MRRKARELALRMLYQMETSGEDPEVALVGYCEAFPYQKEVVEYARGLLSGVRRNVVTLDSLIEEACKNWRLDRVTLVDKAILRLGVYELLFSEDVPPKVAIDEAVELSKKYGDGDSYRFVNGILDRVFRDHYLKKGETVNEGR